jgi:hypothetical protein
MNNPLLTNLTKSIGSKLAWIGGGMAGITVVFSALGFLVIRAHQDLLGVSGLVPNPPENWAVEGARFVYNSVFYILAGCLADWGIRIVTAAGLLLMMLAAHQKMLTQLRQLTKRSLIRLLLIALTLAGLIGLIWYALTDANVSHLLIRSISEKGLQEAIALRQNADGIQHLRLQYAFLAVCEGFSVLWLLFLSNLFGPEPVNAKSVPPETSVPALPLPWWSLGLWGLLAVLLLLLPMKYGAMATANDYFQVQLIPANKESTPLKGWLLHKDKDEIVLFVAAAPNEPIQVVKRDKFSDIQFLTYKNIFAAKTTAPAKPTSTGQPVTNLPETTPAVQPVITLENFLRVIPETIAANLMRRERDLPRLRTLVIADVTPEIGTRNTFSPFPPEESGDLQSPIWLPNDQILFVENRGGASFLKVVSADFTSPAQDFGNTPTPGSEPLLTPDQAILFRQGTKIIRANPAGTERTIFLASEQLRQLYGVIVEENGLYHLIFEESSSNGDKLFAATLQGTNVLAVTPLQFDQHWGLMSKIALRNGQILYAQKDEGVWNIYFRPTPKTESVKVTNILPAGKLTQNLFPAWSPDGKQLVYASE